MLPWISADLPGVQAEVRRRPEDSRCEELLAAEPSGAGHWWLRVRRRGVSTAQARQALARAAGVAPSAIRHAGSRDRDADCIQYFSVPGELIEHPNCFKNAGFQKRLRVLEMRESAMPIRSLDVPALLWRCKLRGGAQGDGFQRAQAVLDRLRRDGIPNYFAASRLGKGAQHAKWGRPLLQGKDLPPRVRPRAPEPARLLEAYQSQLFNRYLAARVADAQLGTVLRGEVVQTQAHRPLPERHIEVVEDVAAYQPRVDAWEVVQLGPLFGRDMSESSGVASARERAILAEAGITLERCEQLRGTRRAVRVRPQDAELDVDGEDLQVELALPCDAYIAVALEELVKPEQHIR